ncbi:lamin tail domain-containing protein [Candidatus Bipolaricaulota bacterium]|nr:lamin tail domain-containing protein [Candidatus Bipolaricaulota bacterium]
MLPKQAKALKTVIVGILVLCWCGCGSSVSLQDSTHLLITEIALHDPEFVEIYNPTNQEVSLSGFWFCYYSSGRVSWENPWLSKPFPDDASICSRGYFLLTLGDDETGRDLLTDWNVYSSKMLSGSGGTVAILDDAPGKGEVVDAVGWGTAHLAVGLAAVEAPEGRSLARIPGTSSDASFLNTGHNAMDFHHALPAPSTARSGIVIISEGPQTLNHMEETVEFSLFNASSTTRLFTIDTESEIGYQAIPQPSMLSLAPGEWGQIAIRAKPYSFFVVDLETTGLDTNEDSIIEAAWVYVCDGEVVQSNSSLIFIGEELDPFITSYTGITDEMLAIAPRPEDVIPNMLAELEGKAVLSYSVNAFDRRFLEAAAESFGLDMPDIQWVNAFSWAKKAMPDLPSHSLPTVAEFLGIEGGHHRALPDSLVTNQVFQEAVRRLGSQLYVTIQAEDVGLPVGVFVLPIAPF